MYAHQSRTTGTLHAAQVQEKLGGRRVCLQFSSKADPTTLKLMQHHQRSAVQEGDDEVEPGHLSRTIRIGFCSWVGKSSVLAGSGSVVRELGDGFVRPGDGLGAEAVFVGGVLLCAAPLG